MRPPIDRFPIALLATGLFLSAGSPAVARDAGGAAAEVEFSRSPSAVILQYHQDIDMLEQADPTPFLRIYGDGRYVVHYPRIMQKAGDWQGRLRAAELESLIRSLADGRLLELDGRAVRGAVEATERERRRAARAAGEPIRLFEVSDKESTRVRVTLERYKPAGVIGAAGEPLEKEILWWGLRHDSRRYPEVAGLRELADLERRLLALAEAPGLERIEGEDS